MPTIDHLNRRAQRRLEAALAQADVLQIAQRSSAGGRANATVVDFGVEARGGLAAGCVLAEICLAGLGQVQLVPDAHEYGTGLTVLVTTDHPLAACMAAQYAGWQIGGDGFFAMGSGPMRAAAAKEPLFAKIGHTERPDVAVGVLECRQFPSAEVCEKLAAACGVAVDQLSLCVAPTASQAGGVQVVARSVETALHKLHELGFDLTRIESGAGSAPLPPVAKNDLRAIGRTNDAVLYGGEVTLWVRGDDDSLEQIGPRVPSQDSKDHGRPFYEIFERYDRDFYKIDPHLFSPAVVRFVNLDTGRRWRFGRVEPDVLRQSFEH